MPKTLEDTTTVEPPTEPRVGVPTGEAVPKIWQIIFIALIIAGFTIAWLAVWGVLNTAFWENDFVTSNRWMIPIGVLFFSLLVGLVGKYLHADNVIHGGAGEKLGTDIRPSYATFPGTFFRPFSPCFPEQASVQRVPLPSLWWISAAG